MIWKRRLTLDELNATSVRTLVGHLGIVYTRLGDDVLEAEMPVDARTYQPLVCCTVGLPPRWRKRWGRWPAI
jgi:acyl-coenzyme A thioesterase PaaI-like protein